MHAHLQITAYLLEEKKYISKNLLSFLFPAEFSDRGYAVLINEWCVSGHEARNYSRGVKTLGHTPGLVCLTSSRYDSVAYICETYTAFDFRGDDSMRPHKVM